MPLVLLFLVLSVCPAAHAITAGDVNGDNKLDAVDVQLVINSALGLSVPFSTDITYANGTNAVDVQLAINAVLGIVIDTDGDGLSDAAELNLGTGVDVADTDQDGTDDGQEVIDGTDPRDGWPDGPLEIPNAPTDLDVAAISSVSITVTWTDNSTNEHGFEIERSLSADSGFVKAGTVGAATSRFEDTGLDPDTEYYYRVTAFNDAGSSDYSNIVTGTTESVPVCVDVDGLWTTTEVGDGTDCQQDEFIEFGTYGVVQDGCDISITDATGTYTGTVDGTGVTWTHEYTNDDGSTSISVALTFDGNIFTGSAEWTRTDGQTTCSGTTDIYGIRDSGTPTYVQEQEPNDSRDTAQTVPIPSIVTGDTSDTDTWTAQSFHYEGETYDVRGYDWYAFSVPAFRFATVISVDLDFRQMPTGDLDLYLLDSSGTEVVAFSALDNANTAGIHGSSEWTWTDGDVTCSGTTEIAGYREPADAASTSAKPNRRVRGGTVAKAADTQEHTPACTDVSGTWDTTELVDSRNCGEGFVPEYRTYTVAQTGCNLAVSTDTGSFTGEVDGDSMTWTGTYPELGGTTTITVNVTFVDTERRELALLNLDPGIYYLCIDAFDTSGNKVQYDLDLSLRP